MANAQCSYNVFSFEQNWPLSECLPFISNISWCSRTMGSFNIQFKNRDSPRGKRFLHDDVFHVTIDVF